MKKIYFFVLLVGIILSLNSKIDHTGKDRNLHQKIKKQTEKIFPELVKIRRDIHQHPELSGQEKKTSKLVSEYLLSHGFEVKTNIGGYGVLGILKTKQSGPILAWRADMDALPDSSPDPVEFRSRISGVRHTCGHDVHTTVALGIANVFSSLKHKIKGTVIFIFQPSEENFQGAKRMIKDGFLDMVKPDAIFALHVVPMPVGVVAAKAEEMFAYRFSQIEVKFNNIKEMDHSEVRIEVACMIQDLDTHPATNIFNIKLDDQNVGVFSPQSALKNYFKLIGDIMARKDKEDLVFLYRVLCSSKKLFNEKMETLKKNLLSGKWKTIFNNITHRHIQPVVYNDHELFKKSVPAIQSVYGRKSVLPLYGVVPMFNDDFALFQQKIPGVYFFLGASNLDQGIVSMPHTPDFQVDETSIKFAVKYFSSMLIALLDQ
jgi:metal-dependent amidase/aminoacylase/carboxypeptidase family protein